MITITSGIKSKTQAQNHAKCYPRGWFQRTFSELDQKKLLKYGSKVRKYGKLSPFKFAKVILHFCLDITAKNTSILMGINRKTINEQFNFFRKVIFENQKLESQLRKYMENKRFMSFYKKRLAKFYGVKGKQELHLKESEWRYKKSYQKLRAEFLQMLKKL